MFRDFHLRSPGSLNALWPFTYQRGQGGGRSCSLMQLQHLLCRTALRNVCWMNEWVEEWMMMWRSAAMCKSPGAWQIAWSGVGLHGCLWWVWVKDEWAGVSGTVRGGRWRLRAHLSGLISRFWNKNVCLGFVDISWWFLKEPHSGSQPLPGLSTRSRAEGTHTGQAHHFFTESRPRMWAECPRTTAHPLPHP